MEILLFVQQHSNTAAAHLDQNIGTIGIIVNQ